MDEEKTIWQGHPSQILNLPVFLICALAIGVLIGGAILLRHQAGPGVVYTLAGLSVVPLLIAFVKWLKTRCNRYELTTERLHLTRGVLSRRTEDVELYRVKDYMLSEPLWLRLFGLGDLVMHTMDEANNTVLLRAVPQAKSLRDHIRNQVEFCRQKKGVRVSEFDQ